MLKVVFVSLNLYKYMMDNSMIRTINESIISKLIIYEDKTKQPSTKKLLANVNAKYMSF
jgi:hypothetical protein